MIMQYYLDTNILAFLLTNKDSISRKVENILSNYENILLTSSVCVMELIHLFQIGKLRKRNFDVSFVLDKIAEFNIAIKSVQEQHLQTMSELQFFQDHTDPNDRLIISQAITDKIPLISSDRKFSKYQDLKFVFNER